jgi:hypothetical protein
VQWKCFVLAFNSLFRPNIPVLFSGEFGSKVLKSLGSREAPSRKPARN